MAQLTADDELFAKLEKQINAFYQAFKTAPTAHTASLISLFHFTGVGREIVVKGESYDSVRKYIDLINNRYLPFSTVLVDLQSAADSLSQVNKMFNSQDFNSRKEGVQICKNYTCQTPIDNLQQLDKVLS